MVLTIHTPHYNTKKHHSRASATLDAIITTADKDDKGKPRSRLGPGHKPSVHRNTLRLIIESALVFLLVLLLFLVLRSNTHPSTETNHDPSPWGIRFSGTPDNLLQFEDMEAATHFTGVIGPAHLKIYVAELPEKYTWKAWTSYVGGEWQAAADFGMPLGPVLNANLHLRMTNQFANDFWWYQQLLISPLRVATFDEADVVFVPGMFARGDPFTEPDMHRNFVEFFQEYPAFLPNVSLKPHIIGYPRVAWDNIKFFKDNPAVKPFLFTTIEAFSTRERDSGVDFVVIPYQSHLHYSRGYVPKRASLEQVIQSKTLLDCVHHEYKDHNTTNFVQSWNLTARSWYCFQPPGDSPTRRSFFDCMLAGTIPVVFDYRVFDSLLPFTDALDWYQLIEHLSSTDMQANNAVDLLRERHHVGRAVKLLSNIRLAARLLQYSLNPVHELIRYDSMYIMHPEDDAFTFSWKAIMRKLCAQQRLPEAQCALRR